MQERFAIPAVGAIIERDIDGEKHILMQTRAKEDGGTSNGLFEIPAGKIREFESVFDALRREVWEETGLTLTQITGEESTVRAELGGYGLLGYTPYCITQNLCGGYSLIVQVFLCRARGEPFASTNETVNIRWERVEDVKRAFTTEPERFYPMHGLALRRYLYTE